MVSAKVRKLFISVFFWQPCVDFMVLQSIVWNVRTSQEFQVQLQPLKITSVKYTYPDQRPKFSSLYHLSCKLWFMDQVYVKLIFWISRRTKVASNQSNIRSSEADEYPVRVGRSKLIHTNLIKTDIDFFTNLIRSGSSASWKLSTFCLGLQYNTIQYSLFKVIV